MKKKWIRKIPFVIAIAALGVFIFSGAVMLLWNNILTPVLHLSLITFWQAAGILLLSKILFGGFKGRHRFAGGCRRRLMMMKWQSLTPEEKERFSSMGYCGKGYDTARC
jgi:Ca2+/H+ antiporter, TMEM165/GDT1 family